MLRRVRQMAPNSLRRRENRGRVLVAVDVRALQTPGIRVVRDGAGLESDEIDRRVAAADGSNRPPCRGG